MNAPRMDWKDIAGRVIAAGAPTLGGALFGPLGAAAGQILAGALGLPAEAGPADVAARLDSETDLAATRAQLEGAEAEWARSYGDYARTAIAEVNATMRAEIASNDPVQSLWRAIHNWEFALECPLFAALLFYAVIGGGETMKHLLDASGLLMFWYGGRFTLMGAHMWTRGRERQVAMTGLPAPLPFQALRN